MSATPVHHLAEALRRAARDHPDCGLLVYDRRGREAERSSFSELLETASRAAAALGAFGVSPGSPVVVSLPTSTAWLESWFGALLAGALPLAMAPGPLLGADREHLERLRAVLVLTGSRHLICLPAFQQTLAEQKILGPDTRAVTPDELASVSPARGVGQVDPDPDGDAFLQLTSGTTGTPRVVRIRHRGVVHNALAIGEAIVDPLGRPAHEFPDAAVVSWLPLFHDMGLVGCLIAGLLHGIDIHLFPPLAFLGRPHLWLATLSRLGPSVSAAPNFGYQLCVERLTDPQVETLDLRRWRVALVGAETVRLDTLGAFRRRLAGRGFRAEALRPCYGLAEATLAVTLDRRGEGPRARALPASAGLGLGLDEVVSLGAPIPDTRVRIVGPGGRPLPDDGIGEVQVAGPGVFAGYYNDPEATARSLDEGWLLTGDLGFLHDGELYLTGRSKDILIVRGQNLMPEELERIVESVTGGGGSTRAAAFSVARGAEGEQIVLVAEVSTKDPRQRKEMADTIRRRIGQTLALPVADVVFVPLGRIPRSTSGKVRRESLRRAYLDGQLASPTS